MMGWGLGPPYLKGGFLFLKVPWELSWRDEYGERVALYTMQMANEHTTLKRVIILVTNCFELWKLHSNLWCNEGKRHISS